VAEFYLKVNQITKPNLINLFDKLLRPRNSERTLRSLSQDGKQLFEDQDGRLVYYLGHGRAL